MKVNKDNMKKNLELTKGIFFSQRVLLELTSKGLRRDKAYRIVQKCAVKSLEKNTSILQKSFKRQGNNGQNTC